MEFINTLEKERNLIYEPDAVASAEEDIKIYVTKENEDTPFRFSAPFKIKIKSNNDSYITIALIILSLIGLICGIILCDSFFETLTASQLNMGLASKIKGGFFANAASSFISMAIWVLSAFLSGLSGISQPVLFMLPAVKSAGAGIVLISFIKTYGVLNGILSFSAFILPSLIIGTLLTLYTCRYAIKASNRLFLHISGKGNDARTAEYYKSYLSRGFIALAGCFVGGIIDAVIGFLCSSFFVI